MDTPVRPYGKSRRRAVAGKFYNPVLTARAAIACAIIRME